VWRKEVKRNAEERMKAKEEKKVIKGQRVE
jgi:hypothetical protein